MSSEAPSQNGHGFPSGVQGQALRVYARRVVETAAAHDCKCVVSDLRRAEVSFTTMEMMDALEILAVEGVDRGWERALIAAEPFGECRFFETIARNRGYSVPVFTDVVEARRWLGDGRER